MVYHVGFDLYGERGIIYNSESKQQSRITISSGYNEPNYFIKVLRLIVGNIQGKLGGICFCWNHNYGENIKNDLINTANNFGFVEVKIIEERYVKCKDALEKSGYKPHSRLITSFPSYVIVIDKNMFTLWGGGQSFLKMKELKITEKELTEDNLTQMKNKIGYDPNFLAYYYHDKDGYNDKVTRVLLQKTYPNAFIFLTGIDRQMYSDWALKEILSQGSKEMTNNVDIKNCKTDDILSDYDVVQMDRISNSVP